MKSEAFASTGVVLSKLLEGANRERQKMVITDESMDVSQFGGSLGCPQVYADDCIVIP